MTSSLIHRARVHFKPDVALWGWQGGFDGMLTLRGSDMSFNFEGQPFALASDLMDLAQQLVNRAYAAIGFDDKTGLVLEATICIDADTLYDGQAVGDDAAVTNTTCGKFTIRCAPSIQKGPPPVPDPTCLSQTGTFSIVAFEENGTEVD